MKTTPFFIVTGKRQNGETLFLVCSHTQGNRFEFVSSNDAARFETRKGAKAYLEGIKARWLGLVLKVERITDIW